MYRERIVIYIALLGFILFVVASFIFISHIGIDEQVSHDALYIQGGVADMPMKWISLLGTPPAVLLITISITILLFIYKMKKEIYFLWSAILSNAIVTSLIKYFVARQRPYPRMENIHSYSFPSWHASTAMTLSIALMLIWASRDCKYRWWILFWGIIVGCSRVYLNVHWCSDVLAGWGLGAFISALLGYWILKDKLIFRRNI